jgi:hypothetical protein
VLHFGGYVEPSDGFRLETYTTIMRERKRQETHGQMAYKFRAYVTGTDASHGQMLPPAIYTVAKNMENCWSDIANHNEQEYGAWKAAHVGADGKLPINIKSKTPIKPPKEFYAASEAWAIERIEQAQLPDELGTTILDRLHTTYKMMKRGGGPPKPKRRMDRFALHHRYTGGGMPVANLGGQRAERFRVLLPSGTAYQPWGRVKNPRDRRRERTVKAWFRVGDQPIQLRVVMHRPLSVEDCFVKRVYLTGEKPSVAMPWVYYLVILIELPKPIVKNTNAATVGIDVGWRKLDDERLRVAVGYDGHSHPELVLPLTFQARGLGEVSLDRISKVKTLRDNSLEATKDKLRTLLNPLPPGFAQMRNGGLLRLLRLMQQNEPDSPVIGMLENWKTDNDRYLRLERVLENKLMAHRDKMYEKWALVEIATKYGVVKIEKMNQQEMWDAEANKKDPALRAAAERRKYASCGALLAYIRRTVKRVGGEIVEVPAEHTTDICSECGALFEAGSEIIGRCTRGHEKDQDWNAAENIYAYSSAPVAELLSA